MIVRPTETLVITQDLKKTGQQPREVLQYIIKMSQLKYKWKSNQDNVAIRL